MAFRTAGGDYGLISRMDWPRIARRGVHLDNTGYMRTTKAQVHELLLRPLLGFEVHHRNTLRADNRRRNITVLRMDVHRAMHARALKGLQTGLTPRRGRWTIRLGGYASRLASAFASWEVAACVRDDHLTHQTQSSLSVFDGTILDADVPELFAAQAGKAMGFTFVARGDGQVRHLSGIERANVVDAAMAERLREGGILLIWSGNRNQWRRVPLAGLLWVTVAGHNVRVLHQREGMTWRI